MKINEFIQLKNAEKRIAVDSMQPSEKVDLFLRILESIEIMKKVESENQFENTLPIKF